MADMAGTAPIWRRATMPVDVMDPMFEVTMALVRSTKPFASTERSVPIRVVDVDRGTELEMVAPPLPARYSLGVPRLDLRSTSDDHVIVVRDDFSTVYGAGDDVDAAVADYLASLVDTVADLEAQEAVLAPGLRHELAALRRHVSRTS